MANALTLGAMSLELLKVVERAQRQRTRPTWEKYRALHAQFPLPRPWITVRIWGT